MSTRGCIWGFSGKDGAMLGPIRRLLKGGSYKDPAVNLGCTEFEVDNMALSEFVARVLLPVAGVKPFPLNELMLMAAAVTRLKPTHIFEWGTHVGKSARIFYETSKAFGIRAEVHSVDLPDGSEHCEHPKGERGVMVRGLKGVFLHQGDGLDTSLEILGSLKGDVLPLFFIDGDHGYASVRRELAGVISGAPGADILLHDTFYQSGGSGYNTEPHRAISDVLASVPDEFGRIDTATGLPGMTLLYRRGRWQTGND